MDVLPVPPFEQWLHRVKTATGDDCRLGCCLSAEVSFLQHCANIVPVACWGIFNPFGPTAFTLALGGNAASGEHLLFDVVANPFSGILATLRGWQPTPIDLSALETTVLDLVRWRDGNPESPFMMSSPSYVVCHPWFALTPPALKRIFGEAMRRCENADLAADCRSIRQHWCKPWDRAGADVQAAAEDMLNNMSFKARATQSKSSFQDSDFEDWWQLVTHPDHCVAELKEMPAAWVGSIEAVGKDLFAAVEVEEGLAFHWRFIHPVKRPEQGES